MEILKFDLEYADNGAILHYEDGDKYVVQSLDDKVIGAFIGADIMGAMDNMGGLNGYTIEIKIKAKE